MNLPPPRARFYAKSASRSHIRLLLDETRHDLRVNQVSRSYFFLIGMAGWLPRLQAYASAQSGPPEAAMTKEISQIANRCGWTVRPVIWWFQATQRGFHFLDRMTPKPLRSWSARRFWGILYPLSFLLMIAYLIAVTGGFAWDDLWLIVHRFSGLVGYLGFSGLDAVGISSFPRRPRAELVVTASRKEPHQALVGDWISLRFSRHARVRSTPALAMETNRLIASSARYGVSVYWLTGK